MNLSDAQKPTVGAAGFHGSVSGSFEQVKDTHPNSTSTTLFPGFTGNEPLMYSRRRTPCPQCGGRRTFAALMHQASGGKCFSCGVFIPPARRGVDHSKPLEKPARHVTLSALSSRKIINATPWSLVLNDEYTDEEGAGLYRVCRYERITTYADAPDAPEREKTFRQMPADVSPRQMKGRDATPIGASIEGVRRVLFGLPAVISAIREGHRIWICEGEKCSHRLNDIFKHELGNGDVATTCAGGARSWRSEFAESLRGATVIVWPDADAAGLTLARDVEAGLIGIASDVSVITPDIVMEVFSV